VRAAVLGSPVAHSLSPALHRAAYAYLGLDWRYDSFECTAEQLPEFVDGLGPGWTGLSLTMPLKRAVLPLLDSYDAVARAADAANTVLFRGGRRLGFNTDVPGMVAALAERGLPGRSAEAADRGFSGRFADAADWGLAVPSGGSVARATIVGSGATARSATVALAEMGCGPVTVLARRPDAAELTAVIARDLGLSATVASLIDPVAVAEALEAPLVISTLPAGAADGLVDAVPARPGALFDVVYSPWPTVLAEQWSVRGGVVLGGLDLLVHQAVAQVLLMTGWAGPPAELAPVMYAAGLAALKP
jgi:shikimate dehydrogenase